MKIRKATAKEMCESIKEDAFKRLLYIIKTNGGKYDGIPREESSFTEMSSLSKKEFEYVNRCKISPIVKKYPEFVDLLRDLGYKVQLHKEVKTKCFTVQYKDIKIITKRLFGSDSISHEKVFEKLVAVNEEFHWVVVSACCGENDND